MSQQAPQGSDLSFSRAVGIAFMICRAFAASVEVHLHKAGTFGERYFGLQTGLAVLVMLVFPVFYPRESPGPLYALCALYTIRCLIVRGATLKRRLSREPQPHSYYNGRPSLLGAKSRIPEEKFKGSLEPALVGLAGLLLSEWNRPLGTYLEVAAASLFICVLVSLRQERMRTLDMHDSFVDQRRIAERWRGTRR